jgi:hypothetical protein
MSPRCPRGAAATMFLGRPDRIAIPRLWVAYVRLRFPYADAWSPKCGRGKAKISATGDFLCEQCTEWPGFWAIALPKFHPIVRRCHQATSVFSWA